MGTDFVGRTTDLSRLAGLLAVARLVTVIGPGGVGKTRVSLRAASEAVDRFADGVWIAELAGLRDPALLPNTVASRLGLPENDARSAAEAVLDHLRGRHLLLILDTCEHLVDACATLAETILREAPRVTLLATSRQPLHVAGEHTCPIAPLPAAEAVELFGVRAAAVVPGFEVSPANRADVVRLCQRLDGIPLAIELAAVQLRALPLPRLVRRLDSRFSVLAGGRGEVPRHETLRTAVEWSHDLCSPAEQALWARLSVFAGTFGLDAVEEVCAESAPEREEILAALFGLVDKSVVLHDDAGIRGYRLLDALREFGAERLAASGQEELWRGRHVARYLRLARRFDEHLMDDEQLDMFHELRREHASIRAALEYTLVAAPGEREPEGAELCARLEEYWLISGRLREGCYWLGKVLDRFRCPSPRRAVALNSRSHLKTHQGDIPGALADIREASAMAEELGERKILADSYVHLNQALTYGERLEEAAAAGEEAARRQEEAGDRTGRILLQHQIALMLVLSGRLDEALECRAETLRLLGEGSKERWVRSSLDLIASFALGLQPGREAEFAVTAREALRAKHQLGDIVGIAFGLEAHVWLAARTGRHERAAWLLGAADQLWQRAGRRLSGIAVMEDIYQAVVAEVREALGPEHFGALWREGATRPLDEIVTLTAADADILPR